MRAVQITRFGGPEVLDVVDLPDPVPGEAEQLYEVSAAGINCADTHTRCRDGRLSQRCTDMFRQIVGRGQAWRGPSRPRPWPPGMRYAYSSADRNRTRTTSWPPDDLRHLAEAAADRSERCLRTRWTDARSRPTP